MIRRILCLLVVSCTAACSLLPSDVKDGVYRDADGMFSVIEPKLPDVNFRFGAAPHAGRFVDFASTGGEWSRSGGYSVLMEKHAPGFADDAAFQAYAKQRLKTLPSEFEGGYQKPVQEGPLMVQGRRAWRTVSQGGFDSIPTWWVGTLIDFGDSVGVTMLLIPIKSQDHDGPGSADQAATWADYPAFTASLRTGTP